MNHVVYFALASVDGYVTDSEGRIDFHTPAADALQHINDIEQRFAHHIYDERLYEIMAFWDHPTEEDLTLPETRAYAEMWRGKTRTVISSRPERIDSECWEVLPELRATDIERIRNNVSGDVTIGGAGLAKIALDNHLLDRVIIGWVPVVLGGGESLFLNSQRAEMTLIESRALSSGWIFTEYGIERGDVGQ